MTPSPSVRKGSSGSDGHVPDPYAGHQVSEAHAVGHEDVHASRSHGGEAHEGVVGSSAGLGPLPPPAHLLLVHAQSPCEAVPGEAAGLLQPVEALNEVLGQHAGLVGHGAAVGTLGRGLRSVPEASGGLPIRRYDPNPWFSNGSVCLLLPCHGTREEMRPCFWTPFLTCSSKTYPVTIQALWDELED